MKCSNRKPAGRGRHVPTLGKKYQPSSIFEEGCKKGYKKATRSTTIEEGCKKGYKKATRSTTIEEGYKKAHSKPS
jgi:hypothetical protein